MAPIGAICVYILYVYSTILLCNPYNFIAVSQG